MITSTLNGANAARRRVHSLSRCVAANPPVHVAASRLPPHSTRAFDDFRGARLHAIALVVLAIHCAIAVKAWRVSVENLDYTAPHALDLQFDVAAAAAPPTARSTPPAGRTAHPAPAVATPARPPSMSPRRTGEMATPENTAQALPSKSLPKTAPNHASKWQPAPSTTPQAATPSPASTDAGHESLDASAAKSPDAQPAPEPLTEPSFGAAYLRNPPPSYPGVAQQRGWQGTVLLKVHVQASGRPDHVGLASSSGHDSLDDAAIEAVTNWRFVPARRGDQAIDGWVQVPIEFKLGT